jgi:hypothetical protein
MMEDNDGRREGKNPDRTAQVLNLKQFRKSTWHSPQDSQYVSVALFNQRGTKQCKIMGGMRSQWLQGR